jgi:1,2-phenylacetyl-CoA epoxidase PaaB subunit
MAYIVMGRDECNQEFRPNYPSFDTEEEALEMAVNARHRYEEARSIWVEMLKDKDYYSSKHQDYWDADDRDMY